MGTADEIRFSKRQPMLLLARAGAFGIIFVLAYITVVIVAVNAREGGVRGLGYTNVPNEAPTFGGQSSYMFDELEGAMDIDVLWIGSSHAFRTFDPRFFDRQGLNTFNMGTTAQTPLNTFFLLREYLDDVDPKVVVIEVYLNTLTWDGMESTLDIMANGNPALWWVRMAFATRDLRAMNALLRRLVDWRRPQVRERQPNLFVGDTYIGRGFVEKALEFYGDGIWPEGELVVRDRQLTFLERTVRLVRAKDVPIVLVTQPLPQSTLDAITNYEDVRTTVARLADRHQVSYVDFNGLLSLDDRADFFDSHHLNQNGLEVFLPAVYDTLMELGVIPAP